MSEESDYPDLQVNVAGYFITPNHWWNITLRIALKEGRQPDPATDLYHKLIQSGF